MQHLTEIAIEKSNSGTFTRTEVACWVGDSTAKQHSLLKRAMAHKEIFRIHRGFYCLANKYLQWKLDPLALAWLFHPFRREVF